MISSFSLSQRAIHWLMAALILFNLLAAEAVEEYAEVAFGGGVPTAEQINAANIHAYVGIAVLVLGVMRLCLRVIQGAPPEPAAEPPLIRVAAKVSHWTFYALFIVMPVAGIGAYYFANKTAAFAHAGPMKLVMWVLIVAHIAGVLVHQFYWRTGILRRMTSG